MRFDLPPKDVSFPNNTEDLGFLVGKKKWCLDGLRIREVPNLPWNVWNAGIEANNNRKGIRWTEGDMNVTWSEVMMDIWQSNNGFPMETINGQTISSNGLFSSCFNKP